MVTSGTQYAKLLRCSELLCCMHIRSFTGLQVGCGALEMKRKIIALKLIQAGGKKAVMEVSSGKIISNLCPMWQLIKPALAKSLSNGAHHCRGCMCLYSWSCPEQRCP